MPAVATNIKFTPKERARIARLGKLLGTSDRPLSMAEVLRRGLDILEKIEASKEAKEKRA